MSAAFDPGARGLPRGRHKLPRELVAQYQRQRLIEAMIEVVGENGYAGTVVADVLPVAGVSRATFYELFDDKVDCFLAAVDSAAEALIAEVARTCLQSAPWVERVRAGLATLLGRLAEDPRLARVVMVEVSAAGPAGRRRHRLALQRFAPFLEEGYALSELGRELSPQTARMAVGGAAAIIRDEVLAGRADALPKILDEAVLATLTPFFGPEGAAQELAKAASG